MPRYLADENFPRLAVEALRRQGDDVFWVAEQAPGTPDRIIAEQAQREQRIILTSDKDFGDLILRQQIARPRGVILCRFTASSPEIFVAVLTEALRRPLSWEDHFAVIDDLGIRLFPFPSLT